MSDRKHEQVLKLYEQETEVVLGPGERLFRIAAVASFLVFGAIGLYLKTHNPPPQVMEEKAERVRQVSFVMEEKKKPVEPPRHPYSYSASVGNRKPFFVMSHTHRP